jgi:hypothetical protein
MSRMLGNLLQYCLAGCPNYTASRPAVVFKNRLNELADFMACVEVRDALGLREIAKAGH